MCYISMAAVLDREILLFRFTPRLLRLLICRLYCPFLLPPSLRDEFVEWIHILLLGACLLFLGRRFLIFNVKRHRQSRFGHHVNTKTANKAITIIIITWLIRFVSSWPGYLPRSKKLELNSRFHFWSRYFLNPS